MLDIVIYIRISRYINERNPPSIIHTASELLVPANPYPHHLVIRGMIRVDETESSKVR